MTELVNYNDSTEASRKYHALKVIAHAADALLLLSATPVRSNEDAFLGILHLLDPATYPLEDLAAFRRRVELRDDLAEAVSALDDETPVSQAISLSTRHHGRPLVTQVIPAGTHPP
jgi:hypothetical protein